MNATDRDACRAKLATLEGRRRELCSVWSLDADRGTLRDVEVIADHDRPARSNEGEWRLVVESLLVGAMLDLVAGHHALARSELAEVLHAIDSAARSLERADFAALLRNAVGFDPLALADAQRRSREGAARGGEKAALSARNGKRLEDRRVIGAIEDARRQGVPERRINGHVADALGCTPQHVGRVRARSGLNQ